MTQTPTNTDLASALREIADTLPLGSALIVRLAADRLDDGGGWIEWDPDAKDASDGPKLDRWVNVDTRFADGSECTYGTVGFWIGSTINNWVRREPDKTIIAYRLSRP